MNEKLQTNTSRVASIFRDSFLDGFSMAGIFSGLRPPNSPTQMFAPELSPEAYYQKRTEEVAAAAKRVAPPAFN
jgi:hypothetical protein